MRKKSTRLLSAALAACMMLSVLPVGAFAAGTDTETENGNGVSAQAEETLPFAGKEITEGGTYTMEGGPYTGTITVEVEDGKDVIINITGNVTTNIDAALIKVAKGHVTINGGTGSLENTSTSSGYSVTKPLVYLMGNELNTTVEINGGTYVEKNGAAITCYNRNGTIVINNGTFESSQRAVIYNIFGTIRIEDGTFNGTGGAYAVLNDANSCYEKNTKTIINNGDFTSSGNATIDAWSGELYINGGTYKSDKSASSPSSWYDTVVRAGANTFVRITGGTFKTGATGKYSRALEITGNTPDVEVTGGVFEVAGPNPTGIFVDSVGSGEGENIKIENATIRVSGTNGCGVRNRVGHTQLTLKNITIENVGASGDFSDILLDNYYSAPVNIEITEDFTHKAVVDATYIEDGLQVTTKTATNYQKNLKLVSADPDYIIDYQKNDDGTEYRYFNKRAANKYYVNAINATASTSDGTVLEPYAQLTEGTTPVKLTADIPENARVTGWKVEKIAADGVTEMPGVVAYDPENPETATMTMPDYDVFVTAEYEYEDVIIDPGTGDGDHGGSIAAGVVIGGIAAVGAYEVGTGLYRITQMDDVAMPTNRLALAKLLWERAGKPEPENLTDETIYSDMDAEDTDAQKAARWAVEQELLNDDDSVEGERKFHPAFPVSKLRVCLTWEKAKQKGLFDQNTEA